MTWQAPYWWESTSEARDQAAQDFDRSVATQFPKDEIPYQRTANSPARISSELISGRSPWVINPTTSERLTGAPGTSLMTHLKSTFGYPSVHDAWQGEHEVGKD